MSELVDQQPAQTFVVRPGRETAADGRGYWRGRVEHVASQQVG